MKGLTFTALLLTVIASAVTGQELPLVTGEPGTFEILSRTDYAMADCGFTKTEMTANLQNITSLVNIVRKNPVLSDMKGFNGRARIYNVTCKYPGGYGIPARISFEFSSFFRNKTGKTVSNSIEPPEWSLITNDMIPGWAGNFNTKHGYYTVPLKKETLQPGIDVYDGECYVLYDPSRPPYWIPVTVNEAFAAAREENNNNEDKISAQYISDFIEREYAEIPESDRNKPAYFGGNVSRVSSSCGVPGQDSIFPYIMKVNQAYWDMKQPRSDIQFLYFNLTADKEYLRKRREEALEKNSISYNVYRFEESLSMSDIKAILSAIK